MPMHPARPAVSVAAPCRTEALLTIECAVKSRLRSLCVMYGTSGVQVAGCGKPILMVHGFGASIGHWKKNIPALAAAGYQVCVHAT